MENIVTTIVGEIFMFLFIWGVMSISISYYLKQFKIALVAKEVEFIKKLEQIKKETQDISSYYKNSLILTK
jgi:hypothetical protein